MTYEEVVAIGISYFYIFGLKLSFLRITIHTQVCGKFDKSNLGETKSAIYIVTVEELPT